MQIKNKYYPYPVIAADNDSYESSTFTSDVDFVTEAHYVKFVLCAEVQNEVLSEMIAAGSVTYAHHIECQQTCFRKLVLTSEPQFELSVHESQLNGLVQVCTFLMANQDITAYTNPDFSRDYRGIKFNLDRGCIMAIGSQVNITINKDKEVLDQTSSIFSIRKDFDPNHKELRINTNGPKIVILIPEKTCNQYLNISNTPTFVPVMHSMVIFPALMQVLFELKEASQQHLLYNYEGYRWFSALKKTAQKLEIKFTEEDLAQMDAYMTAQLFLDTPVVKAMDNICGGDDTNNG